MHTKVIKVLDAHIRLVSNTALIHNGNYFSTDHVESLLSDFGEITELPADSKSDTSLIIVKSHDGPELIIDDSKAVAIGDFEAFEVNTEDKRFTLLGNQGLLYRLILSTLEKKHEIYSFHANALYNESSNELIVFFGGAGSGKSPALMAGLCKHLRVFGTELVHFSIRGDDLIFYRSSCYDNIRPQCIHEDFPELITVLKVPNCENFYSPSSKFLLNMSSYSSKESVIRNPKLRMIVPKVEMGRKPVIYTKETKTDNMTKMIFDNLSEKIGSSFIMYNKIAVPGFDTAKEASSRLKTSRLLVKKSRLQCVEMFIAPPRYFLEIL